jgi:fimbrial chaperone protein
MAKSPARRARALAIATLVLAVASIASAGTVDVNPTRIVLTTRARSALLTLRNGGRDPLRYQVSVFDWRQSPHGQMELRPTEDIVCFPTVLSIEPGQERRIRIGTTGTFAERERSYRVFIEEIAPAGDPGGGIRVLTRLGVPVFLQPRSPHATAALEDLALGPDGLTFTLRNTGNVHVIPDAVAYTATDEAGRALVSGQLESWYVLAGSERRFQASLNSETCSRVRHLAVEARLGSSTLVATLEIPSPVCRAAP